MGSDELRDLLKRNPFDPFRVRVTSGDAYEVRNPDLAVPMKSRLFVAMPGGDQFVLIPYPHIAAIETLQPN